jgi:hypothetical protein
VHSASARSAKTHAKTGRAAPRIESSRAVLTSDEQKDLSQMNDLPLSETNRRALNTYNARQGGLLLSQLAAQYSVSMQRVHQLELRGRSIANDIETKNVAGELSQRTRNALVTWNCEIQAPRLS